MADEPVNGEPVSEARFPAIREKNSGRLAKSRPSERSKISSLEDNSLEIGTGNFIAPNREFIKPSRELQRLAGNRPPRHRFSRK